MASYTAVSHLLRYFFSTVKCSCVTLVELHALHWAIWSEIRVPPRRCSLARSFKLLLVYPMYWIPGSPRHLKLYTTFESSGFSSASFNWKWSLTLVVVYTTRNLSVMTPLRVVFSFLAYWIDGFPIYGIFSVAMGEARSCSFFFVLVWSSLPCSLSVVSSSLSLSFARCSWRTFSKKQSG